MAFIGKGGCSGMEEEIKHLLLFFWQIMRKIRDEKSI
jgi:hypothetical protein